VTTRLAGLTAALEFVVAAVDVDEDSDEGLAAADAGRCQPVCVKNQSVSVFAVLCDVLRDAVGVLAC